ENCTAVVQSTLEAAVPISRLAECITLTKTDTGHEGVPAPIVGHVGDGTVHLAFVLPPGDGTVLAKAAAIKTGSLEKEHASAIPVMGAIKNALDPPGHPEPRQGAGRDSLTHNCEGPAQENCAGPSRVLD
ncbi:MAG: FAD-linked oxidase C-terminal domain-containing protein, partial [Specibacter sp.]